MAMHLLTSFNPVAPTGITKLLNNIANKENKVSTISYLVLRIVPR